MRRLAAGLCVFGALTATAVVAALGPSASGRDDSRNEAGFMVAINANLPSGVRPGQLPRRELIAEGDRACAWLSDQASRKSTGTLVGTYREFSRAVAPHSDWRFGNGYLSFRADVARGGWFYLCPDVLQRQIPNADD